MRLALWEFQFLLKFCGLRFTALWSQLGRWCWGVLRPHKCLPVTGALGVGCVCGRPSHLKYLSHCEWGDHGRPAGTSHSCVSHQDSARQLSPESCGESRPQDPMLYFSVSGHLSMRAFPVSGSLSSAHPWPGGESITGNLLWRRFDINDVVPLGLAWLLPDGAQSSYAHCLLFSFFFFSDRQACVSPRFTVVASEPPSFLEVDIIIWFCKTLPWERWGKSTKDFPVVVSELAHEPMIISTTFQLKEGLIKILFKCQNNYCGYG